MNTSPSASRSRIDSQNLSVGAGLEVSKISKKIRLGVTLANQSSRKQLLTKQTLGGWRPIAFI